MNSSLKTLFAVKSLTILFGVVIEQHKFDSQQKRGFLFILESLRVLTSCTQMEKSSIQRALLRRGLPTFGLTTEANLDCGIYFKFWKMEKFQRLKDPTYYIPSVPYRYRCVSSLSLGPKLSATELLNTRRCIAVGKSATAWRLPIYLLISKSRMRGTVFLRDPQMKAYTKDTTKVVIILLFHMFILVSKLMHLKVNIANICKWKALCGIRQ